MTSEEVLPPTVVEPAQEENADGRRFEELVIPPGCIEADFSESRINEITGITDEHIPLTKLCLRNCLIKEIKNISGLVNLLELDLYNNQITKLENLDFLCQPDGHDEAKLELLDLSFNRITKLENITFLTNLKKLYLVKNRITVMENLEKIKALELLELGGNKLKVISPMMLNVPFVHTLTELYLGENKISKIENLDNFINLKILALPANKLTKIEKLSTLIKLKELYISENFLTEIEGLDSLSDLHTLDLASNQITKINNIGHLTNLREFWFNSNKVASWANVEELGKIPKLTSIYLEHNPIYYKREDNEDDPDIQDPLRQNMDPNYRRKIMLLLPNLEELDGNYCR